MTEKILIFAPYEEMVLYPFSLIYDLITTCRNWLYDKGLFKSTKFQTPIIGVGNFVCGRLWEISHGDVSHGTSFG